MLCQPLNLFVVLETIKFVLIQQIYIKPTLHMKLCSRHMGDQACILMLESNPCHSVTDGACTILLMKPLCSFCFPYSVGKYVDITFADSSLTVRGNEHIFLICFLILIGKS